MQADEIRVRVRGGAVWAALALDVGSRLWLATAVARRRDGLLVHLLLRRTLATLAGRAFLLAVDGFAGYVDRRAGPPPRAGSGRGAAAARGWSGRGLRARPGGQGRAAPGEGIVRRIVVGTEATVAAALAASHGGATINTAYIERLNAMLREHLAPLVRRRRTPAHGTSLVESGLHLLRLAYNYCWTHESLRLHALGTGPAGWSAPPRWPQAWPTVPTASRSSCGCRRSGPPDCTAHAPPRTALARGRVVPFHSPPAPPERSAA